MDEISDQLLAATRAAYRAPPRAYHSWRHVQAVLRLYEEVAAGPGWDRPAEVRLAVLLHDAVHLAGRPDNEVQSARLALALIAEHLPGRVDARRVAGLIRLTARHGTLRPGDVDRDAALFLDCDMAILGAAPGEYDRYEAAIAEEYAAVPADRYRRARRGFLARLLETDRIFLSGHFHARLDAAARANLRRALGYGLRQRV